MEWMKIMMASLGYNVRISDLFGLVNGHLSFDIVVTTLVIAHLCLHRSTYIFVTSMVINMH